MRDMMTICRYYVLAEACSDTARSLLQQSQLRLPVPSPRSLPLQMTGPPPASAPPSGAPPPFPVYPCPPPMRFKPGEPFIPHLTYMEGQFAAQALIVEQQRRIKALEAELASTQVELMRLRNMSPPQRPVTNSRVQPPVRHDSQSQQAAGGAQPQDEAKKASSRYWTAEEHTRFLEGLELFGQKDIKAISRHVGTRSATQVRTHAQKYYLRIQRERLKAEEEGKQPPSVRNGTPTPRKAKGSPGLNGRSGNSNQSNNGSRTNTHTNNSHSNSHNNSSSSTRNHSVVNNNVSNSHSHTPVLENPSDHAKPSAKSEQIINSAPQPTTPYVSQSCLVPNSKAARSTSSNPAISVPNMPTLSRRPPCHAASKSPASKSPIHSTPSNKITMPNCTVGNMSMGPSPRRNLVRHQDIHSTKPEPTMDPIQLQQAEGKRQNQTLQPGEAQSTDSTGIKKEELQEMDSGKRAAPATPKRSPKKRAKKPSMPPSSTAPVCPSSLPQPTLPKMNIPASAGIPTSASIPASVAQPPTHPLADSGGSMSNLRALLRVSDDTGPSASKPPTLRRNGSSNSVLADLSKNYGVLSRSESFISPNGKGFTRSNSILSLLSGIPTALRESPSTERLLGLDGEDKVMSTLKAMDAGGSGNLPPLVGAGSTNSAAAMGDRSFSFGQLNHMGLDDLEDPGAVALALPEEQKWGDG